jgi:phospholipid-binding lipoprotein MlaA
MLVLLSGCATVPPGEEAYDPSSPSIRCLPIQLPDGRCWSRWRPLTWTYPGPVRTAVSNFFDNLGYLNSVSTVLQGKFREGFPCRPVHDQQHLGILGLFDVATPMGLSKHEEDFRQT